MDISINLCGLFLFQCISGVLAYVTNIPLTFILNKKHSKCENLYKKRMLPLTKKNNFLKEKQCDFSIKSDKRYYNLDELESSQSFLFENINSE